MSIKDKEKRNLLFNAIHDSLDGKVLNLEFYGKSFMGQFNIKPSGDISLLGKLTPILIDEFSTTQVESYINITDRVRLEKSFREVQLSIEQDKATSLYVLLTGFFCPIKFPTNKTDRYNVYDLVKIDKSVFASLFASDSIPDQEFLTIYELTDLYYKYVMNKTRIS